MSPLAAWDAREEAWFRGPRLRRARWLRDQGLPADAMYRAEFYVVDAPFARIFCYRVNEQGHKRWDEGHDPHRPHDHKLCGPATVPPYDVPLNDLPPAEIL